MVLGGCMVLGGGAWSRGGLVETPPTATAAGGMHPTGMHSCSLHFSPIRTCEVRSFISWDGTLHSFCVHSPTFTTVQLVIIMFMIKVFDHCVKDSSLSSLSEPNSSPSSLLLLHHHLSIPGRTVNKTIQVAEVQVGALCQTGVHAD